MIFLSRGNCSDQPAASRQSAVVPLEAALEGAVVKYARLTMRESERARVVVLLRVVAAQWPPTDSHRELATGGDAHIPAAHHERTPPPRTRRVFAKNTFHREIWKVCAASALLMAAAAAGGANCIEASCNRPRASGISNYRLAGDGGHHQDDHDSITTCHRRALQHSRRCVTSNGSIALAANNRGGAGAWMFTNNQH